jgi:hypothetical protein
MNNNEEAALSCADLAVREEQDLMVNQAAMAAQYAANFVLRRQVIQMGTYFNLEPTTMMPVPSTLRAIAAFRESLEGTPDQLTKMEPRSGP